jgi:hypothetical protein
MFLLCPQVVEGANQPLGHLMRVDPIHEPPPLGPHCCLRAPHVNAALVIRILTQDFGAHKHCDHVNLELHPSNPEQLITYVPTSNFHTSELHVQYGSHSLHVVIYI